jgi:quercetin dioxygenase-like cupin family protein
MRFLDFAAVTPREVAPGYLGRYVHSDQITQGRVDIAPGAVIPEHCHPHEQWTLLLSGSLELTVSGTPHVLQPGQILYIAPHAAFRACGRGQRGPRRVPPASRRLPLIRY